MIRLSKLSIGLAVAFTVELPLLAWAADDGIASRGATGGLTIPSAHVLAPGDVAVSGGDFQEPQLGRYERRRNLSFGIGLFPNLEFFGRRVEYQNPLPGVQINGPRDVSANAKLKLPSFWRSQPDWAIGATDFGGGAKNFRSVYVVASDSVGWVDWTLGFAHGSGAKTFDGAFGGIALRAGETGLSALAEHDGRQNHVGLRYRSPGLSWLGGTELVATVQRSLGARDNTGRDADRTSFNLSAVVPLEQIERRPRTFKPEHSLKSLEQADSKLLATPEERLGMLQKALVASGLERIRVGRIGADVVIEYENHVFGQSEADAIGVVLGLGSELAPTGTQRVRAVTLKAGLPVYETSVGALPFRNFLREGDTQFVSGSLAMDRKATPATDVQWTDAQPSRRAWAHLQLEPLFHYTMGTEIGAFDYSVGANLRGFVPLWRGAELYANYVDQLANSTNYDPGNFFGQFRQRTGLQTVALQQSFWVGPHALASVGAGRYNYEQAGVQLESSVFVPGRDDVVRLKAAVYDPLPGQSRSKATPLSASYRWAYSPTTWVEAGVQQYTDGTRGPSLELTRWFGDVAAHLFYRRGGTRQFAGFALSIPLTPQRGFGGGGVTFNGATEFTQGYRTRLAIGSTKINFVQPDAAVDFPLDYGMETRMLDRGRVNEKYFIGRLHRMREVFYRYARDRLPE
jgi:hypothetical protein